MPTSLFQASRFPQSVFILSIILTIHSRAVAEQDNSSLELVQLLRQSLSCPLQTQLTELVDGTAQKTTRKRFSGDTRFFNVTGTILSQTHDLKSTTVEADEETFLFAAPFDSIDNVNADGNAVTVWCANKEFCIMNRSSHKITPPLPCSKPRCDGGIEKEHFYKMLTLRLCNKETTDNARDAIQQLILVNRRRPPASQTSDQ
jgi:hypothetical protein